jgi:outer membrane protein
MNRNFARFIPTMTLALILSVPAFAQPAAPAASAAPVTTKVGIVNLQAAIVGTNEGQRDFEALQKKFDPKRSELENLKKEVDDLQKKFNTQADKLNDEARNDLLKQIDAKKKTLQRSFEDSNADFQAQQDEIATRIGQKLLEVLDKYSKGNGFTVILDVSANNQGLGPVVWAASSVNITTDLVEAYNTQSGVAAPAKSATAPAKPAAKPAAPAAAPKKQ